MLDKATGGRVGSKDKTMAFRGVGLSKSWCTVSDQMVQKASLCGRVGSKEKQSVNEANFDLEGEGETNGITSHKTLVKEIKENTAK